MTERDPYKEAIAQARMAQRFAWLSVIMGSVAFLINLLRLIGVFG